MNPEIVTVDGADGVRIVTYDHGGDGPDVLLLHATGMHGRVWDPVVARMDRCRVVAVDARGHGASVVDDAEAVPMAWDRLALDVEAVIDHHRLDTPVVAAHSMGGCLAVMVEARRPGTFAGAWLFEPIIAPTGTPDFGADDNPLAAGARRRREVFSSRAAAYERYMSRPPFAGCDPDVVAAYVEHGFEDLPSGEVRLRCRGETEARTFEGSRTDAFDALGGLDLHATVIASGDGGPPATFAPLVAEAMPDGTLERWDDRTHFGPLEDPERVSMGISSTVAATLYT